MSYFLCLCVPQEVSDQLPLVFDKRIYQTDVSELPIGRTTRGENPSWTATLLQVGSSSASLVGKGANRKTHNNDHTELFASGLQALLNREDCSCVTFLFHWMHGYITTEKIPLRGEKFVDVFALSHLFLKIEEDVRYVVSSHTATNE